MPTVIVCNGCRRRLRVADTLLGKAVKCPHCQARNVVPGGAIATPPALPAAALLQAGAPPQAIPAVAVPAVPAAPQHGAVPAAVAVRPAATAAAPRPTARPAARRDAPQGPGGVAWYMYLLGLVPLGLVAIGVWQGATGRGPLWEGFLGTFWMGLGVGLSAVIMGLGRLPKLPVGVQLSAGVVLAAAGYVALGAAALLGVGGKAAASLRDPATWKTFTSKEGRFEVSFPGEPEQKTAPGPDNTPIVTFAVERKREQEVFLAMYSDRSPERWKQSANEVFDEEKDGLLSMIPQRKTVTQKTITLRGDIPGREIYVDTPANDVVYLRMFYHKGRFYAVMAKGVAGQTPESALAQFVSSFRVTGDPPETRPVPETESAGPGDVSK